MDAVGEEGTPLVFLLSPHHGASPQALDTLAQWLGDRTGLAIDVQVARDEQTAVSTTGTHYFDVAILPLFDYLFCHHEYDVQAGLQVLRGRGNRTYRGEILVRSDSEIDSLEDLDERPVAFVDSYSTSGFLYPVKLIREAGARPTSVFTGSHQETIRALREGRVDAAAAYAGAAGQHADLRTIASTEEIPNEPVFFRAGLPEDVRTAVIQGLLAFAETDDGRRVLDEMANITGFVEIDDEAYREVYICIQEAGRSIQDVVRDGWRIYNVNQLTPADFAP